MPVPQPNSMGIGPSDPLVVALTRIAASLRGRTSTAFQVDLTMEAEALELLASDIQHSRFGTAANPTVLLQVAFPTRDIQWPLPRSRALRVVERVEACIRARSSGVPPNEESRVYRANDTRSEEGGGSLCGSVFDLGDAVGASAMLPPGSPFYAG